MEAGEKLGVLQARDESWLLATSSAGSAFAEALPNWLRWQIFSQQTERSPPADAAAGAVALTSAMGEWRTQ